MSGRQILVIRPSGSFSWIFKDAGFDVIDLELIETRPLDDLTDFRAKLERLNRYDGLFFTSPEAAKIFVAERNRNEKYRGNIYALGGRATQVLVDDGLIVRSSETANTAAEFLNAFDQHEFAGKRFLFIRGDKSVRTIPETLSAVATVVETVVYSTVPVAINDSTQTKIRERLESDDIEWACFFSPSGIERFDELFAPTSRQTRIAAIGTTTAEAAEKLGYNVDFVSPKADAEDFANGLIEHIRKNR